MIESQDRSPSLRQFFRVNLRRPANAVRIGTKKREGLPSHDSGRGGLEPPSLSGLPFVRSAEPGRIAAACAVTEDSNAGVVFCLPKGTDRVIH